MKISGDSTSAMLTYFLVSWVVTSYSLIVPTTIKEVLFYKLITTNMAKKFLSFCGLGDSLLRVHKTSTVHLCPITSQSNLGHTVIAFFFELSILMSSFYLTLGLIRGLFHFTRDTLKKHNMVLQVITIPVSQKAVTLMSST
jgi:hypothetical protein